VTAADLLQWAENSEQLSNLLKGFANGNPQKQIAAMVGPAKRGHRTLDPRRSKDIHKRALRRYGSDVARKKREKEIDNYIKKRTLGGNLSKIKYHERREQFKQAHGRVSAVASNKVLLKLIDETRMEYKDLLSLREEFASAIGARPENGYISIDYKTLKGCLISKFPHLEDGSVLDHIVHVFDVDGNQKIDFSEFACGLSKLLLGSVPEQLSFMFSMFDQDGDGSIQLWEVVELVEEAFEDRDQIVNFLGELLRAVDIDGDGKIGEQEFISVLLREKITLNCLWTSIMCNMVKATPLVDSLRKQSANDALSFDIVQPLYDNMVLEQMIDSELHFDTFWELLSSKAKLPNDCEATAQELYNLYVVDGRCHQQKLFSAIAKCVCGTDKQRAKVVSLLANPTGAQSLTTAHIEELFERLDADLGKFTEFSMQVMSKLDEDKDGTIDQEEMQKLVTADNSLFDFFTHLFYLEFGVKHEK